MSATVKLIPSGHTFEVQPDETVLEAALRSGFSLHCGCTNGTCGKCIAKKVSGEFSEIMHHDFVLGEEEKNAGAVLLCRAKTESDMVLEARESNCADDIPVQEIETTVSKIERPADDIILLNLRTPRSKTLQFLAGQNARLEIDGAPVRYKSIASCPCNGMVLQFHVCRHPDDPFSEYVFDTLKARQAVRVSGPYGRFLLDEESRRPIVFIAYESGFSPIKSIIEHAIALEFPQPIRLYWMTHGPEGHYMDNYCRSWQDALDDFQYFSMCAEPDDDCDKAMARVAQTVIDDEQDIADIDVYVNGPTINMETLKDRLLGAGLPCERLFIDDVERV